MLFAAHWHWLRVFDGIPTRRIYDYMRTAVDHVGRRNEREVNIRFLTMADHHISEHVFCNPTAG